VKRIKPYDLDYILLILLGIALIVLVIIQVTNRIIPFRGYWTLELLTFTLGGSVWMGVSTAIKEDKHINMNNLVSRLSPRTQKLIGILNIIFFVFYLVLLAYLAIGIFQSYLSRETLTPALRINRAYMRGIMLFGCLFSVLRLIEKGREIIKNTKKFFKTKAEEIDEMSKEIKNTIENT